MCTALISVDPVGAQVHAADGSVRYDADPVPAEKKWYEVDA